MIWLNGAIRESHAAIDTQDRGLLLGESLFETMLVERGKTHFWEAHLHRLKKGCALLNFAMPYDDTILETARDKLVEQNNNNRAALRLTVTGGAGGRGLVPENNAQNNAQNNIMPNWIMQLTPTPTPPDFSRLHISTIIRQARHPLAQAKTGNYLDAIMARRAALLAQCDEAILLNQYGRVAGCAAANFYLLYDGKIITPPISEGALPGIIRGHLLQNAAHPPIEQAPITIDQLRHASAFLLSNSLLGVVAGGLSDGDMAAQKKAARPVVDRLLKIL